MIWQCTGWWEILYISEGGDGCVWSNGRIMTRRRRPKKLGEKSAPMSLPSSWTHGTEMQGKNPASLELLYGQLVERETNRINGQLSNGHTFYLFKWSSYINGHNSLYCLHISDLTNVWLQSANIACRVVFYCDIQHPFHLLRYDFNLMKSRSISESSGRLFYKVKRSRKIYLPRVSGNIKRGVMWLANHS